MSYYVVLRRFMKREDVVSLYDEHEAIKRGWVNKNGERVWAVPTEKEFTPTFVWKFDDIDHAIVFFELIRSEIGIKCSEF